MTLPSAPPELASLYPFIRGWNREASWATIPTKKIYVTSYSRVVQDRQQRCSVEVAHKDMANAEVAEFLIGDQLRRHHGAELRKLGKSRARRRP